MCDEWTRKDGRIHTIHKENGGLSDARNSGIAAAKGELITFVDSDDFIASETYEQVIADMGHADMIEFPVFWQYGTTQQQIRDFGNHTYNDMKDYWLNGRAYTHSYACNKIYRRGLFDGIRYPIGKVFEDVYTLPRLLRHARRITTISQGLYYYCWNSRSITATARGDQLRMLLDAHLTAGLPMDDTCYLHVLNIQMDVCELTGDAPRLAPRRVRIAGSAKQRLKTLALNIIGIKGICKINKFLHHFKQPSRS
jgi:glycosyltransferase involved in cell wall biosynthesis